MEPNFTKLVDAFRIRSSTSKAYTQTYTHPQSDCVSTYLETGVIRYGDENATTVIFLTSGMHGAEQAAGSICQFDVIDSGTLATLPKGIAVVIIHAINPVGAFLGRRYTEENVDLCRNFIDYSQHVPHTLADYQQLQPFFDVSPSQTQEADAYLAQFARNRGNDALYAAVMSGQYLDATGIGFGGKKPTWARQTLEHIMTTHAGNAQSIYALDYHTGVGPYAYGSIIAMQKEKRLASITRIFGDWVIAPRDNPPDGFIDVRGHSTDGYEQLFPHANVQAVVLEVGTFPNTVFIQRLLTEHRATRFYGYKSRHPQLQQARQKLVDFFIPSDKHWLKYLRHRGRQVFTQILQAAQQDGK